MHTVSIVKTVCTYCRDVVHTVSTAIFFPSPSLFIDFFIYLCVLSVAKGSRVDVCDFVESEVDFEKCLFSGIS